MLCVVGVLVLFVGVFAGRGRVYRAFLGCLVRLCRLVQVL